MKILVTALSLLALSTTYAAENDYKHQVSFGNNLNSGWSSTGSTAKTDGSLGIEDFSLSSSELSFNYAHRLGKRFQVGLLYSRDVDQTEIEMDSGSDAEIIDEDSMLTVFGIYNFNEDFKESWYIGYGISRLTSKEKTTNSSGTVSDQDYEVNGSLLLVGKRFSLDYLGIQNLTYSPMLSYQTGKVDGDLEDDGLEEITQVTFDILKLDLLF